jgi:hypothetical protein
MEVPEKEHIRQKEAVGTRRKRGKGVLTFKFKINCRSLCLIFIGYSG